MLCVTVAALLLPPLTSLFPSRTLPASETVTRVKFRAQRGDASKSLLCQLVDSDTRQLCPKHRVGKAPECALWEAESCEILQYVLRTECGVQSEAQKFQAHSSLTLSFRRGATLIDIMPSRGCDKPHACLGPLPGGRLLLNPRRTRQALATAGWSPRTPRFPKVQPSGAKEQPCPCRLTSRSSLSAQSRFASLEATGGHYFCGVFIGR